MEPRSAMSEVKLRVRQNALLWREFTASQMVEFTGLKPESVRTELQRMKAEGLLEVERGKMHSGARPRGGQPVVYRLTSDPEKRLALSRGVAAFTDELPQPTRPTSRHFALATRLLDQASTEKDARKCEQLLVEAEEELDFALVEEWASRAPGPIRALMEFQRARVAYVRGRDEHAERLFGQARQALVDAGLVAEAARADEFLLCIKARRHWTTDSGYRPQIRARLLLEDCRDAQSLADSPLLQLFAELLGVLAETPYDQVISAVVKQAVTAGIATAKMEERMLQYERRPSLPVGGHEFGAFSPADTLMAFPQRFAGREFYVREHEVSSAPVHDLSVRQKRRSSDDE